MVWMWLAETNACEKTGSYFLFFTVWQSLFHLHTHIYKHICKHNCMPICTILCFMNSQYNWFLIKFCFDYFIFVYFLEKLNVLWSICIPLWIEIKWFVGRNWESDKYLVCWKVRVNTVRHFSGLCKWE